jgi:hypothetical protein
MERFQDLVGRRVKGRFKILPLVSANVSTNAQRDRGSGTHQRDEDNGASASNGLSLARGQPFPLVFQLVFDLSHRDGVIAFSRFLQMIGMVGLNAIHRVHLSRIVSKIKNLQVRGGPFIGPFGSSGLNEGPTRRGGSSSKPVRAKEEKDLPNRLPNRLVAGFVSTGERKTPTKAQPTR